MSYNRIASLSELEEETPTAVEADGTPLVLVRIGYEVHACEGLCSHEAAGLAGGFVEDGCIECPRHGALFDLSTGAARTLPATQPIRIYPTRVEGDDVLVSTDPETP
jgi:nitrite reductase/ring-hydroxylating ferredoxin subunit